MVSSIRTMAIKTLLQAATATEKVLGKSFLPFGDRACPFFSFDASTSETAMTAMSRREVSNGSNACAIYSIFFKLSSKIVSSILKMPHFVLFSAVKCPRQLIARAISCPRLLIYVPFEHEVLNVASSFLKESNCREKISISRALISMFSPFLASHRLVCHLFLWLNMPEEFVLFFR